MTMSKKRGILIAMKKPLKVCFLPCAENNNKPKILKNSVIGFLLAVVLVVEAITLSALIPGLPFRNQLSAVLPSILVAKTNETRLENKLNSLSENVLLAEAAQIKANDMTEKGYFSHTTPEGYEPWHFLNLVGYKYEVAGENLAVNFVDSGDVHKAWMKSSTHKANILKDKYQEIGIATAKGEYKGKDAIFVVQFFGTPKVINENPLVNVAEASSQEVPVITSKEIVAINDLEGEEVQGAETSSDSVEDIGEESVSIVNKSPKALSTGLLIALGILISIAVILKIFVKIKVQYKDLILNGLLFVIIIITFVYLNHNLVGYFGEIQNF